MMHNTKSKISGMISKGFKPEKCKVSLRMAMSRMKLLRNKREAIVKQMRRDIANLLDSGQDQTARIRVEHVIREEKTMAAYELIELYCELIIARLPIIDSQKNCPIDLKEAIASVIFASPRCADLPELMDVKKQFMSKYGKDFVTCALELRPDSGVSTLVIEKLSAKAPDLETKIKILTSIAEEHNINWDSKELLDQLQKPKNDFISGPTQFASASQMSNISFQDSFVPPNMEYSQNIPIPPEEYSSQNPTPNISAPLDPQFESNSFETESSLREEVREKKYKDEQDAARAAAESARAAAESARTAAELASRINTKSTHKEEETKESVEVFDEYDDSESDHEDHHKVFEPFDKKRNLEESSRFGEYSSDHEDRHKVFEPFSSTNLEESSHFGEYSSESKEALKPTYDSDGYSSDNNDNENGKKLESLSIYEEEKEEEEKEQVFSSYDDYDDNEGLNFNFGKLTGGLKNKPRPRPLPLYVNNPEKESKKESGYSGDDLSSDEEEEEEEEEEKERNESARVGRKLPPDYDSFAAHFHSLRSSRP